MGVSPVDKVRDDPAGRLAGVADAEHLAHLSQGQPDRLRRADEGKAVDGVIGIGPIGQRGPIIGAFSYGLLFAPMAIPCSGPFLVGFFTFSLTIGDALGRLLFFGAFGVGFGLPLFLLGTIGTGRGAQVVRAVVKHERALQLVVGVALIAVGAWDLASNLPRILG
ncbi:MAG: cytochrome c biogenesis protein CcdA [Candidatus Limnocylindria bacterium]